MQMSRERFQEVHKLIWNTAIAYATEIKRRKSSLRFLKSTGVERAYVKGLIDYDELVLIKRNNSCLLCAMSEGCETCPLGDCNCVDSLYTKASHGDKYAMLEIRDMVDKQPFTELSVVTLYDV